MSPLLVILETIIDFGRALQVGTFLVFLDLIIVIGVGAFKWSGLIMFMLLTFGVEVYLVATMTFM